MKKNQLPLLLAMLFVFYSKAIAFEDTVSFRLIESESRLPIPYATVYSLSHSSFITTTNELGEFSLEIPVDSVIRVTISHVGFVSSTFDLTISSSRTLSLNTKLTVLDTIDVSYQRPDPEEVKTALKIIENALAETKKQASGYIAEGNYQYRCKENGQSVELTDGRIELFDKKGYSQIDKSPNDIKEEIIYKQKRQSLNSSYYRPAFFGRVYNFELDEFAYLQHNILKYRREGWRDGEAYIRIRDSLHLDNKIVYQIEIDQGYNRVDSAFGDFSVITEMAFQIEVDKSSGASRIIEYHKNYHTTRLKGFIHHKQVATFAIRFTQIKGNTLPQQIRHIVNQQFIKSEDTHVLESSHMLTFDEWVNSKKSVKKHIQEERTNYNHVFWSDQPVRKVEQDELSGHIPLDRQFALFDKQEKRIQQQKLDILKPGIVIRD